MLDPILATLVALNILWAGWSLMRESVGGLMDEAVPTDLLDRIRGVIAASAAGALEAHDLRTRAGRPRDLHRLPPGGARLDAGLRRPRDLRRDRTGAQGRSLRRLITIHVEPEEKAKHHGVVVL